MKWLTGTNGLIDVTSQVYPIMTKRSTYNSITELMSAPIAFVIVVVRLMKLQGWK